MNENTIQFAGTTKEGLLADSAPSGNALQESLKGKLTLSTNGPHVRLSACRSCGKQHDDQRYYDRDLCNDCGAKL